ncbi:MAG: hypothetical protein R2681_05140 [Pyrinomonadaceae bacterium]
MIQNLRYENVVVRFLGKEGALAGKYVCSGQRPDRTGWFTTVWLLADDRPFIISAGTHATPRAKHNVRCEDARKLTGAPAFRHLERTRPRGNECGARKIRTLPSGKKMIN